MAEMTSKIATKTRSLELLEAWQDRLYGYVLSCLRNEADAADVTQEALLSIIRNAHQLSSPENERAWAFQIARRAIGRHRVSRDRDRARVARVAKARVGEASADIAEERDLKALVNARLAELPADLREAVELRYFHGLTQVEVSEVLGLPRGTVRSRIDRGLSLLRESLSSAGCAVLVPELEVALSVMELARVPGEVSAVLRASVLKSTAPASLAASGALILGGFVMNVKTMCAVAIVALVGFGLGAVVTKGGDPRAASPRDKTERIALLEQQNRDLEEVDKRRSSLLAAKEAELAELRRSTERLRAKAAARPSSSVPGEKEAEQRKSPISEMIDIIAAERIRTEGKPYDSKDLRALEVIKRVQQLGMQGAGDHYAVVHEILDVFEYERDTIRGEVAAGLLRTIPSRLILASDPEKTQKLNLRLLSLASDKSHGEETRGTLLYCLRTLGLNDNGEHVVAALRELIVDSETRVRKEAALKLTLFDHASDRGAIEALILDRNEDSGLREIVATTYLNKRTTRTNNDSEAAPSTTSLLDLMQTLMSDREPRVRAVVVASAADLPAHPQIKARLEGLFLQEADPKVLAELAAALAKHGDAATRSLLEQARPDRTALARSALELMNKRGQDKR